MRHRFPLPAHRRPRPIARVAAVLGALALAACASPPSTHFYSLMPTGIAARSAAPAASGITIVLEPVRLPAQVDQPQWLVQLADDSMAQLEQERWAGPLRDEFRQALLEELIVDQGAIDARTHPRAGGLVFRIVVDVRRFDSLPGHEARIEGSWTITGSDGKSPTRCEWLIREPAPGPLAALAAAHRRAVARLGVAIGQTLAGIRRGGAATCPPLRAEN